MSQDHTKPTALVDEAAAEQIARLTRERDAARQALTEQRHERFKANVRLVVTWLHRRAQTMNDPQARMILDVAAGDLAADLNGGRLRAPAQAGPAAEPSTSRDSDGEGP